MQSKAPDSHRRFADVFQATEFQRGVWSVCTDPVVVDSQVILARAPVNALDMYEYPLHTPTTGEWNEHTKVFFFFFEIIKLPNLPPGIWGQIARINRICWPRWQ